MEKRGVMHPVIKLTVMSNLNHINIPQACQQSWQQMTPDGDGRHCQHCCKTVIDFTAMTTAGVISYLETNNNVCGRFDKQQLNFINHQLVADDMPVSHRFKAWAMVIGLAGSITSFKAAAQIKAPTVQTTVDTQRVNRNPIMGKALLTDNARFREIKGLVLDNANIPLPGVQINATSTNLSTITDSNGNFRLFVPLYVTQFTTRYIGFQSQVVNIDINAPAKCQVKLVEEPMVLGEVVIVKQPFFKRTYYKFIKRPIRKLFK
jgi:hypothetical protein